MYVIYSFQLAKQLLAHIILKFRSVWCPECVVFDPNIMIQRPGLCYTIMHRITPHSMFVNFWLKIKSMCWIICRIHLIWPRAISLYYQNWNWSWKDVFYNNTSTIKTATTRALEATPQNELEHAFESLFNRCNKCIETGEEYFELKNRKIFRYLVSMMFSTASLEIYLSHCVHYTVTVTRNQILTTELRLRETNFWLPQANLSCVITF